MDILIVFCGIIIGTIVLLALSHKVRNQETRHYVRIFGSAFLVIGIVGLIRIFTGHQLGS